MVDNLSVAQYEFSPRAIGRTVYATTAGGLFESVGDKEPIVQTLKTINPWPLFVYEVGSGSGGDFDEHRYKDLLEKIDKTLNEAGLLRGLLFGGRETVSDGGHASNFDELWKRLSAKSFGTDSIQMDIYTKDTLSLKANKSYGNIGYYQSIIPAKEKMDKLYEMELFRPFFKDHDKELDNVEIPQHKQIAFMVSLMKGEPPHIPLHKDEMVKAAADVNVNFPAPILSLLYQDNKTNIAEKILLDTSKTKIKKPLTFKQKVIKKTQKVINNFKIPEKLPDNVILTCEKGSYDTCEFTDIKDLDEYAKPFISLSRNQQGYFSDRISEKISEYHEEDVRYSLLSLQISYDLAHSKTKEGNKFRELMNDNTWLNNRERIRSPNLIFPDSLTFIEGDNFVYRGSPIEVKININDVFDTLEKAGLFKQSKSRPKIYRDDISFDENGESSLRSGWDKERGCFTAISFNPDGWGGLGIAVFGKTNERMEIAKTKA